MTVMKKVILLSISIILVLGLIGGASTIAYLQWRNAQDTAALLAAKNDDLMRANLELGRAQTAIVEQDTLHRTTVAQLNQAIQDEIKKRNALITMYAQLEAAYNTEKKRADGLATTLEEILATGNTADLKPGTLFYKRTDGLLVEVKQLNWNYKDFRITLEGDMTPNGIKDEKLEVKYSTTYQLHQKFKVKMVEAKLPTGAVNHYAELFELDDKGAEIGKLQLTAFNVQITNEKMKRHWSWWNPKLDLVAGGAVTLKPQGAFTADIGISLSSFGVTKNDVTLRFFRFGVGYMAENAIVSFSPVQYNIGEPLPLVSNIWIVPSVGYTFGLKSTYFALGVGVVF
jgi:hypothetical protein